jgi:hypothetical protein
MFKAVFGGALALAGMGFAGAAHADCKGPPFYFSGNIAEVEAPLLVKTGTGCTFGVNGIQGAISEVKITQSPKNGQAGVQNLRAVYVAKPGYQGPDEFAYTMIGTDQYGGPMRLTVKRKITVVPSL